MENVILLGNNELAKIPVYSFMIRFRGQFLHFNFVGKLLNDLFGIQCRTGCSCASVYGQNLLGISNETTQRFKEALCTGNMLLRVGYIRLNFSVFQTQEEMDYVLKCIDFVQAYGWMFLPNYTFSKISAEWSYRLETEIEYENWLSEYKFGS
jgi:selenocysteine lyase/cysteine desulfurase